MNLLVLTQNNCRYCGMVKQYLDDNQVEYETVNMSEQPEYQEKYDVMGAPTILLLDEDDVISKTTGFNPSVLETFIDQL
jgi:thioredoxin 1